MNNDARFVHLVYEAGNFRLGLELGLALRDRGAGTPILVSPYYLPETAAYAEECAAHGIAYVHEATALGGDADALGQLAARGLRRGPDAAPPAPPLPAAALRARLARRLTQERATEAAQWEAHYRGRIATAFGFLRACAASALLLPEDNVERDSACWIRAMHALGGSATVVSYGAMNRGEAAIAYYEQADYQVRTAPDRWFARLYPRWSTRHRGRRMLRLPQPRALAMEVLGLAPADPWLVNTGEVDAIVVESEFMKSRFVAAGIRASCVHAAGHAGLDRLAEGMRGAAAIRQGWTATHGYDGAAPVVLCAMPPDQYPAVRAPEFASYEALVDAWAQALLAMRPGHFPAVSPHPNIRPAALERIRAAGLPVLEGGAARWIPACDLYAASVSGTIKWALACAKPVVNYDCYRYGHDDFAGLAPVVHAGSYGEFRSALGRFAEAPYARRMAQVAAREAPRFGTLDGRAADRIARLVRNRLPGGLRCAGSGS